MITVVIPLGNKKQHIRACLKSVFEQTHQQFELIVVDDASSDGSVDEIKDYARNPRFRLLRRAVAGPGGYAARNLATRNATNDWIAFLDADDMWEATHLENIIQAGRACPPAVIYSSGWRFLRQGKLTEDRYTKQNRSLGMHTFDLKRFIQGTCPMWTSVVAIKKSVLESVGGFNEKLLHGGDQDLWLRLMLHGYIGVWMPGPGAIYNQDAANRVTRALTQEFSPTARSVRAFLQATPNIDSQLGAQLRRFANSKTWSPALRLAGQGRLKPQFVAMNFFPERSARMRALAIAAYLPGFLQSAMASLFCYIDNSRHR